MEKNQTQEIETQKKNVPEGQARENKMGIQPVNRLLLSMSLPMMISMVVQAMYNVVDSIFVSRISENALTAVSLAFPLQNLMIAVGSGTGVGINAMLSKALGEKKQKEADDAANNGIFLILISILVFMAIGFFGAAPFFASQTDNAQIRQYGTTYVMICLGCCAGIFLQMTFERLLQSTGRTLYTMITQGTGAVINIILDPILIFGLFGFPKMGVAGAALATVFGQFVAAIMAFAFNQKRNPDVHLSIKGLRPHARTVGRIYSVGVPSIIMMSIGSIMTYLINRILLSFSDTAAAVFGVYFKLQSFIFMPVFGLNNGLIPILAYNYGARSRKRINEALRLAIIYAVSVMFVGMMIFQIFPSQLLGMFNASPEMVTIGVTALRRISLSFVMAGFCIALGSVFQAFSRGMLSMYVSIGRQLVILIPAAYLLAGTGEVSNVWWAFPIAEIASLTLSVLFFRSTYQKCIKTL